MSFSFLSHPYCGVYLNHLFECPKIQLPDSLHEEESSIEIEWILFYQNQPNVKLQESFINHLVVPQKGRVIDKGPLSSFLVSFPSMLQRILE